MIYIKNIGKSLLSFIITIVALLIVITIFNYFNILNYKIVNLIKFIIPFIASLVSGYTIGIESKNKGYLEGIKVGLIIIIILLIFNILGFNNINISNIINYILIILFNTVGSMIGINRKNEK
ncbi:MAG: TIGR04086 family membrane protein [Bacilli bacterium]|nr:TIGR04086 family membrane protein [Bacilli bacterium]